MEHWLTKYIIAGNHIRRIKVDGMIFSGYKSTRTNYEKSPVGERTSKSLRRTQDNIVLTIDANVNHWSKFLTLTFADQVYDRSEALKRWHNFLHDYKRHYGEALEFVRIIEKQIYQEEKGPRSHDNTWHFHAVVFNNRKIQDLEEVWGHGFVKIEKVDDEHNLGKYFGKYLSKEYGMLQKNERGLSKSQGLKKPSIRYDYDFLLPDDAVATYEKQYFYSSDQDPDEILTFTQTDYITLEPALQSDEEHRHLFFCRSKRTAQATSSEGGGFLYYKGIKASKK